jgi:Formin Homology 2 Domain
LLRVDDSLTLDLLQALLNMMLTPDEVSLLEDYDGDRWVCVTCARGWSDARVAHCASQWHSEQLGKVEKFYICLLDIKNCGNRLKALIFKSKFDSVVAELLGKMSSFMAGAVALRDSRALRTTLEHVLAVGASAQRV